jgi:rhodanese-related sulfurtransferase
MKSGICELSAIILLAALGSTTVWLVKGPPERAILCDVTKLKPDEVCLEQLENGTPLLWVDARSRDEWLRDGLPGSVLWNLDPTEDMQAFEAEVAARVYETPRVIVYCGDENCGVSRQVAQRIREIGLDADVSVLHGGWRALEAGGRIKGSSPTP